MQNNKYIFVEISFLEIHLVGHNSNSFKPQKRVGHYHKKVVSKLSV